MLKQFSVVLVLCLLMACGGNAPKQRPASYEPFTIMSSIVNPQTSEYTISIVVDPPLTEENAKKAAIRVYEKNKGQFKTVVVKSFARPDPNSIAFAESRFEGDSVTHKFNAQAAPQNIPSH
jgi:hypothetical protein